MKHVTFLLFALSATAVSAQVNTEKKAAFIALLEQNDCRMNNFSPKPELIDDIAASGLERQDIRAIGQDMMSNGEAELEGEFFVLKTGACK